MTLSFIIVIVALGGLALWRRRKISAVTSVHGHGYEDGRYLIVRDELIKGEDWPSEWGPDARSEQLFSKLTDARFELHASLGGDWALGYWKEGFIVAWKDNAEAREAALAYTKALQARIGQIARSAGFSEPSIKFCLTCGNASVMRPAGGSVTHGVQGAGVYEINSLIEVSDALCSELTITKDVLVSQKEAQDAIRLGRFCSEHGIPVDAYTICDGMVGADVREKWDRGTELVRNRQFSEAMDLFRGIESEASLLRQAAKFYERACGKILKCSISDSWDGTIYLGERYLVNTRFLLSEESSGTGLAQH